MFSAQAEFLRHSLEKVAVSITYILFVNSEFICLYQDGDISSLNGKILKSIYQFTHTHKFIYNILLYQINLQGYCNAK